MVFYKSIKNSPSLDWPKYETVIYRGEKGATASLNYNTEGFLENSVINCPEIDELEQRNIELDYKKKEKDSERNFNMEFGKLIRGTLLGMTLIVTLGWVAKSFISR